MTLSPEIITFLICLDIVLLGFAITLDLAFYSLNNLHSNREDNDSIPFLDSDGNHTYYERSLIEKTRFLKLHKNINIKQLRSFRRFFKQLIGIKED